MTLDEAHDAFVHHATKKSAGDYLDRLIAEADDDMIDDVTFMNGLCEICDWLTGYKGNPQNDHLEAATRR
jgi:hypothetical protein